MDSAAAYRAYASEDVVTGEGVAVELPVASVPLRLASGAIDLAVTLLLLIGVGITFGILTANTSRAVSATFAILASVLVLVVVPTVVETLTRGKSLGRWALGMRVVRDDGGPVTARHSLTRALIGSIEVVLLSGIPAVITAMLHPRAKRLGDMAAGTYAVTERAKLRLTPPPLMPPQLASWAANADIASLPPGLAISVRQFLARAQGLGPQARAALGGQLLDEALRHVAPMPPPGHHPETVLAAIIADRRRRDAERLAREDALRQRVLPAPPRV